MPINEMVIHLNAKRKSGSIDVCAEIKRLQQELAKLATEMDACEKRLSNRDFMEKAKPEIIEEMQERLESFGVCKAKIEDALLRLNIATWP